MKRAVVFAHFDKDAIIQDYVIYYLKALRQLCDKLVFVSSNSLDTDEVLKVEGIADYIITMRKDGENDKPIKHTNDNFPVEKWQDYASPVWMDIKQSYTLNRTSAREERDEKHICPLQLDVIERCIDLWTAEGDIVFTPFLGIGSEAYQALKMKRKAVGIELKESYYKQAVKNCYKAIHTEKQIDLFEDFDI